MAEKVKVRSFHADIFLNALDRSAFEKIAKATTIDFVEVKKVPKVTISTDLEKVLSVAV